MKKYVFFILLTFLASQTIHSQQIYESRIRGKVTTVTDNTIKIGTQIIPIAKDGSFTCTIEKEWPVLLSASYAGMHWTVFMKSGSNTDIFIPENKIEAIEYRGDYNETNSYLIDILTINQQLNQYLNKNWQSLHKLEQKKYVAKIDSLKNIYLEHLTSDSEKYKSLSNEFIDIWKKELDFGFNELILKYPERHLQFTKLNIELTKESIEYALSIDIDKQEYLDIPNYKVFAKACIEMESNKLLTQANTSRNYNLKKIKAAFIIIEKLFSNQYLKDFWLAEYLKGHIDNNGLTNSEKQLKQFYSICKTDIFKNEIDALTEKITAKRIDHEIYVYKTADDFALEAHFFRPENTDNSDSKPAIAIFHGGGWVIGNASWAFGRAKHFAKHGMVAIAVQYRLSNYHDITPVEAMEDTRDLMIWLRENSGSLGINPDKIAGEGWSAGGHLITSAAFFPDSVLNKNINSVPNAIILKSPALEADSWCIQLLGARNIDPNTISPLDNIKKGMFLPPILIFQGRKDHVTPVDNALLFNERMKAANYQCELVIYEDCGHLFTPSYLDDTGWPRPDKEISKNANKKADEFLSKLGYIEK